MAPPAAVAVAAAVPALMAGASMIPFSDPWISHLIGLGAVALVALVFGSRPALFAFLLVAMGLVIHVLIGAAESPSLVRMSLFVVLSATLLFAASSVDRVRQAAARRLQRARGREALLRSIVSTMPDAMIVSDQEGRIRSVNPAATRMFGWYEHELLGQSVVVLMREREAAAHDGAMRRYLATGQRRMIGFGRTLIARRKDGSDFPAEITLGEATAGERVFTAFIRDLSEQALAEANVERLRAELAHVSRASAMGAIASTLAHEINQPIANVANYVESVRHLLASGSDIGPAVLDEALQEATQEALRAGEIVRHIRELVSTGDVEKSVEDLHEIVDGAGSIAFVGAREQGIQIEVDVPAVPVLVDRVQIQQVLINLIRNAREAMQASDERRLSVVGADIGDGMVRVTVSDTGSGVSPAIQGRLFEAFATTKPDGMGMGLSICRTIVEANGGRIWAEPGERRGTRFHFTLPRSEAPAHG